MERFFNTAGPVRASDHYHEAHLIGFDRRPEVSWEDKVFRLDQTQHGRAITVWGM